MKRLLTLKVMMKILNYLKSRFQSTTGKNITSAPLPSVVQFENLKNQIYECAGEENNIPKYILLDNDFEVLAFLDLFPYSGGG